MNFTKRTYALTSGISIIIMAIAAGYSYGYVHKSLIIADDSTSTLTNLLSAKLLFGSGIIGWFVIAITDLLVAWSLYKYFYTVNDKISLATGLVRVVYTGFLILAIYHLIAAWQMLHYGNQEELILMNLIENFQKYWSLGLILFGIHLVGLGYLSIKSKLVSTWISLLLFMAGISYSFIHGAKALVSGASDTIAIAEMIMSAPMAIAELGLAVWLIWIKNKN